MPSLRIVIFMYISMFTVIDCSPPVNSWRGPSGNLTKTGSETEDNNLRYRFPCERYQRPDQDVTVHTLTPMDVRVVGAMGDSITAGFAVTAKGIRGLRDDRGMSFSAGGDETIQSHITLPNILRFYNPELKGFSVGHGVKTKPNAHLNVAETASISRFMQKQAIELVSRMKYGDEGIDYDNDWKIITLLIGANDICSYCFSRVRDNLPVISDLRQYIGDYTAANLKSLSLYSPETYVSNVKDALDILHQLVPKTLVNLIQVVDLVQYHHMDDVKKCNVSHRLMCPCLGDASNGKANAAVSNLAHGYTEGLRDLVNSGRYDTRKDFTVVIQPFLEKMIFLKKDGKTDLSYFAIDCFHLSRKGQELAAKSLWTNMLEPVGKKSEKMVDDVICPSSDKPYFYTRENSKVNNVKAMDPSHKKADQWQKIQRSAAKPQNEITTQTGINGHGIIVIASVAAGLLVVVVAMFSIYLTVRQKTKSESAWLLDDNYKVF